MRRQSEKTQSVHRCHKRYSWCSFFSGSLGFGFLRVWVWSELMAAVLQISNSLLEHSHVQFIFFSETFLNRYNLFWNNFGHLRKMSVGEMSVSEMSIGEMSVGEMSRIPILIHSKCLMSEEYTFMKRPGVCQHAELGLVLWCHTEIPVVCGQWRTGIEGPQHWTPPGLALLGPVPHPYPHCTNCAALGRVMQVGYHWSGSFGHVQPRLAPVPTELLMTIDKLALIDLIDGYWHSGSFLMLLAACHNNIDFLLDSGWVKKQ